jgi:hypothetical protein
MYLYKIPSDKNEQPEWFRERLAKAASDAGEQALGGGRSWVWEWNETYERKISIRDGCVNLMFEDEADYVWFSLGEL